MAESIPLNLFAEFTAEGLSENPEERQKLANERIQKLLTEEPRPVETTWLEFKSGFTEEGTWQAHWSELIGAFANTGGGVVIWGVYAAREKGDVVDTVRNIQYVPNVNELHSKLKQAAHTNTNPPLSGIRYYPIITNPEKGRGFIVCYIPEGAHKPYDSLKAEDRFYMRFDDETKKLGVETLRLLFYPQLKTEATVTITCEKKPFEYSESIDVAVFTFNIANSGFTSFDRWAVQVNTGGPKIRIGKNEVYDEPFSFQAQTVLHPGMAETFHFCIDWKITQLSMCIFIFQLNQEMKKREFTYDFLYGRFIYEDKQSFETLTLTL